MVSLTFYGGVDEIGGNKILLKADDTSLMLDFGLSFNKKRQYYPGLTQSPNKAEDLIELGLLPKLNGLYEFDESEKSIDGVLLSHSHLDHSGYIKYLKNSIPVYCGKTTKIILDALDDITSHSFKINHKNFNTFRTGNILKIGSLDVEPIHVDHSIPGSYGYIIHTSEGAIIYTGDFRLHGNRPDLTEDFINKSKETKPQVMISEGTNMVGATVSSEKEIKTKLSTLFSESKGIIITQFNKGDIDRLNSFIDATKHTSRKLVINTKQAYLLDKLKNADNLNVPNLDEDNLLIYKREKKRYQTWEKNILNKAESVGPKDISKKQKNLILITQFYDLKDLVSIKPEPGSCFILSASEPFNEEMKIEFDSLINWLDMYGLPQYQLHVSGHIMPQQLRQSIETIKPKHVFPIHTEHAKLFKNFMRNSVDKITIVKQNQKYKI